MQLTFEHAEFLKTPYPIGVARPVLDWESYKGLVEAFPPDHLLSGVSLDGVPDVHAYKKFALNERTQPEKFYEYLSTQPLWWAFHTSIKKPEFPLFILGLLKKQGIDIPPAPKWSTRFEFSGIPADGGYILPHLDTAKKVCTLIFSMVRPGEWNPAFGGGTDVLEPLDPTEPLLSYRAPLEKFRKVHTYAYVPNQCVLFVKNAVSWHSVGPLLGAGSPLMRRTITLNIERP